MTDTVVTSLHLLRLSEYIENNTWVSGNTRFISSVEHDISRVSAANDSINYRFSTDIKCTEAMIGNWI